MTYFQGWWEGRIASISCANFNRPQSGKWTNLGWFINISFEKRVLNYLKALTGSVTTNVSSKELNNSCMFSDFCMNCHLWKINSAQNLMEQCDAHYHAECIASTKRTFLHRSIMWSLSWRTMSKICYQHKMWHCLFKIYVYWIRLFQIQYSISTEEYEEDDDIPLSHLRRNGKIIFIVALHWNLHDNMAGCSCSYVYPSLLW